MSIRAASVGLAMTGPCLLMLQLSHKLIDAACNISTQLLTACLCTARQRANNNVAVSDAWYLTGFLGKLLADMPKPPGDTVTSHRIANGFRHNETKSGPSLTDEPLIGGVLDEVYDHGFCASPVTFFNSVRKCLRWC